MANVPSHLDTPAAPERPEDLQPPRLRKLTPLRIDDLLSFVILACGLFTVVLGAYLILSSRSTVPIHDEWTEIDIVAMAPHHSPPLSWLWAQHNEHRIVFYRLLLLVDIYFCRGRHWIYFWTMLAVQCASLALLFSLLRIGGLRGALMRIAAGLGAFCLFCPTQWQNFGWAFQISFLLPILFLQLAVLGLIMSQRPAQTHRGEWIYLSLSILAASAATYSNGNGVVVWPVLLLVAVALRVGSRVLATYTISACLLVGSYLFHYASPSPQATPLDSLRHPANVLLYFISYLGLILPPWVKIHFIVAASTGAFGVLAGLAASARVLLHTRWRRPLPLALVGFMLFSAGTAFITALGKLASFGVEQAFQSRYQTFNLLFWLSTVSLWLLIADEEIPLLRRTLPAVLAVAMLGAVAMFPLVFKAARLVTHRSEAATMPLLTGVPDRRSLDFLSPDPDKVWRDRDFLQERRLFVFSGPLFDRMNQPVSVVYREGPQEGCTGQVQSVERVSIADSVTGKDPGGLRISGWAIDRASQEAVHSLVIVAQGRIVGFAVGGIQVDMTGNRSFLKKKLVEWSGSAQAAPGIHFIDVYAEDNHQPQVLCHLATAPVPVR